MNIQELRYFLAAAKFENLHRAAVELRSSPPAVSKAVSRLEDELGGIKLFERQGRGIRLTEAGVVLRERAAEIVLLEEAARAELGNGRMHVTIAGRETLLAIYALPLALQLRERRPRISFELVMAVDEQDTIRKVSVGEASLGITSDEVGRRLPARVLATTRFQTFAGPAHPLRARRNAIPIGDVLEHGFVVPTHPLLGTMQGKLSVDGWRDDRFPRRIDFVVPSYVLLKEIVEQGLALAHLPDHLAPTLKAKPLVMDGCPYVCEHEVRLFGRRESEWLLSLTEVPATAGSGFPGAR